MESLAAHQDQRSRLTIWVRSLVAVLLLAAIVGYVDAPAILSTALDANLSWIAAALLLLPLNLMLEAVKWQLLLSGSSIPTDIKEAAGSVLAGYALGFLTPARVGDYAGRVLFLAERRKGVLLVLATLDRMYSFWIYTVVGTVILGFQLRGALPGSSQIWLLTFALGVALVLGIGVIIASPKTGHAMIRSLLRGRWDRLWQRHTATTGTIKPATRLAALLLSFLRYGVFSTQFVLLVLAFAPGSPILALYAAVALVFFAKTVIPSISLFDLGIRESAAIFFLGMMGVTSSAALNASLLLFAANVALPALIGILFIPNLKWTEKPRTVEARTG